MHLWALVTLMYFSYLNFLFAFHFVFLTRCCFSMAFSLLLVLFTVHVAYSSFGTFPQILLCSKNSTFPDANCVVRVGAGVPFSPCSGQQSIEIQVYADDNLTEYCTAFAIGDNAEDPYSIVTFTTDVNQGLLVDHVLAQIFKM